MSTETTRTETAPAVQAYVVDGMTCGHCVAAVTEEVGGLPGVTEVAVDLPTGRLTFAATPPVPVAQVREAVEEAGYALAG